MKLSIVGVPEKISSWFCDFNNFIINSVIIIILHFPSGNSSLWAKVWFPFALEYELQEDVHICLFCSWLCVQCLQQCLVCWMSRWMILKYIHYLQKEVFCILQRHCYIFSKSAFKFVFTVWIKLNRVYCFL